MEKQMNDIENKIDDLFDEIEKSKLYKDYVKAKKKLENNCEIMNLIYEIKRYQKISANNKDESVDIKIKGLYNKLNAYPLYQSYLIIKEALEEELFTVKNAFETTFNDMLNLN